jgi:Tfp pilus assembly major pilin PilA
MAMPKKLAWFAVVVPMIAALGGCIYETTIDDKGAGQMMATFSGIKRETLDILKSKMESSSVKVLSADFTGSPESGSAVIKLRFDDVIKLSTTEFFRNATFTRSDGVGGTTILTAVVRNNTKAPELSDTVLAKLGKELKSVVTFPGDVVESNGTVSGGRTVSWTWNL